MASTPTLPATEADATKKSIRLPPGSQVPIPACPASSAALGSNSPLPSAAASDQIAAASSFQSPPATHWAAPSSAMASKTSWNSAAFCLAASGWPAPNP